MQERYLHFFHIVLNLIMMDVFQDRKKVTFSSSMAAPKKTERSKVKHGLSGFQMPTRGFLAHLMEHIVGF